jgi:hypothetical protein
MVMIMPCDRGVFAAGKEALSVEIELAWSSTRKALSAVRIFY